MLPLGTTAPSFTLQDVREDRLFSLAEPAGEKGLLVLLSVIIAPMSFTSSIH